MLMGYGREPRVFLRWAIITFSDPCQSLMSLMLIALVALRKSISTGLSRTLIFSQKSKTHRFHFSSNLSQTVSLIPIHLNPF
jgi:hypothetical protein